jgi:hypothetical protein
LRISLGGRACLSQLSASGTVNVIVVPCGARLEMLKDPETMRAASSIVAKPVLFVGSASLTYDKS